MSDNLIRLPLSEDARKPVRSFLAGLEAGRKLRHIFWLAERSWCEDFAPWEQNDGELTGDEYLERLKTEIVSLRVWMKKHESFNVGTVGELHNALHRCHAALETFFRPPPLPIPETNSTTTAPENDEFSDRNVRSQIDERQEAIAADGPPREPTDPRVARRHLLHSASQQPEFTYDAFVQFCANSPFVLTASQSRLSKAINTCCKNEHLQWQGYLCGFICEPATNPLYFFPRSQALDNSDEPLASLLTDAINALYTVTGDERLRELRDSVPSDAADDWRFFQHKSDDISSIISLMQSQGVLIATAMYVFGITLLERIETVKRTGIDETVHLNSDHFALLKQVIAADGAMLAYTDLAGDFRSMLTRDDQGSPNEDLHQKVKRLNLKLLPLKVKVQPGSGRFQLCEVDRPQKQARNLKQQAHKKRKSQKRIPPSDRAKS